jgi:hypothetical protein
MSWLKRAISEYREGYLDRRFGLSQSAANTTMGLLTLRSRRLAACERFPIQLLATS